MTRAPRTPGILRFSTASAAGEDPLSSWERHQAESLVGLRALVDPARPLQASARILLLEHLGMGGVDASAHGIARDDHQIAARPAGGAVLYFVLRGHQRLSHRSAELSLSPGQAVLLDGDSSFTRAFPQGVRELVLVIPRTVLPELGGVGSLAQPRVLGFARTPGEAAGKSSATRAVAERMGAALHGVPTDPEALEDGLMRHLSALLAAEAPAADHLAIITRAIEERCSDPALDAARIAEAAGISTRQLSRVLGAAGTSVPSALLTARTDAARAIMADPARSHLSMAEIAQRTGFASPAQFSRAVRGRFGITPLRLRRDLLQH